MLNVADRCLFPAMITYWRKEFQLPSLPFFYVLLAAGHTAMLREAQYLGAGTIPHTAFASAVDLGATGSEFLIPGHPPRKQVCALGPFAHYTLPDVHTADFLYAGGWPTACIGQSRIDISRANRLRRSTCNCREGYGDYSHREEKRSDAHDSEDSFLCRHGRPPPPEWHRRLHKLLQWHFCASSQLLKSRPKVQQPVVTRRAP